MSERIVVVGAGFAGFHCAKALCRLADDPAAGVEVVLINPTDYLLYLPLLPRSPVGSSTRVGSPCRSRPPCPGCG
jgi:NADH dehydrogenase